MDEKKMETIITMFAPLDFLNAIVYPSISKPIEKVWDDIVVHDVENAKDNGLRGIYELAKGKLFNEEKYGNYEYSVIDQEILNKLLKGEIKTLQELKNMQEIRLIKSNYDKSILIYTILHFTKGDENTKQETTYIDSIFINE